MLLHDRAISKVKSSSGWQLVAILKIVNPRRNKEKTKKKKKKRGRGCGMLWDV